MHMPCSLFSFQSVLRIYILTIVQRRAHRFIFPCRICVDGEQHRCMYSMHWYCRFEFDCGSEHMIMFDKHLTRFRCIAHANRQLPIKFSQHSVLSFNMLVYLTLFLLFCFQINLKHTQTQACFFCHGNSYTFCTIEHILFEMLNTVCCSFFSSHFQTVQISQKFFKMFAIE